jgi:hypothetical protein
MARPYVKEKDFYLDLTLKDLTTQIFKIKIENDTKESFVFFLDTENDYKKISLKSIRLNHKERLSHTLSSGVRKEIKVAISLVRISKYSPKQELALLGKKPRTNIQKSQVHLIHEIVDYSGDKGYEKIPINVYMRIKHSNPFAKYHFYLVHYTPSERDNLCPF